MEADPKKRPREETPSSKAEENEQKKRKIEETPATASTSTAADDKVKKMKEDFMQKIAATPKEPCTFTVIHCTSYHR